MTRADRLEALDTLAAQRVVVLDGAMGTMIQNLKLQEADFRGERFKDHDRELQGDNDILNLSKPEAIVGIHDAYLDAGADIIQTNTFNATSISQLDYGLQALAREINRVGAELARRAADAHTAATGRPGPSARSARSRRLPPWVGSSWRSKSRRPHSRRIRSTEVSDR